MRICYFTHDSNVTGANRSMLDMIDGLKTQDVDIVVVLRKDGLLRKELEKRNIRYKIEKYYSTLKSSGFFINLYKRVFNRFAVLHLSKVLKSEAIDIVHNNDMLNRVGAEVALKIGLPYVCHLRDMIQEDHGAEFLDNNREMYVLDHASCVICISKYVYDKFARWMPNQKNIVILHNGINSKNYYIEGKKILQNDTVNVSMIGRVSLHKRQMEAIQAIDILNRKGNNNVVLNIIGLSDKPGDKEYIDSLNSYIQERQLHNVHMYPFTTNIIDIQKGMDVGLMCSDHEAMGRSTIESMIAGNITIGAAAGATTELIQDGINGFLYKSGEPEALANVLISVMNNRERAIAVAVNGRKYAIQNFDITTYGSKIFGIYSKISDGDV